MYCQPDDYILEKYSLLMYGLLKIQLVRENKLTELVSIIFFVGHFLPATSKEKKVYQDFLQQFIES